MYLRYILLRNYYFYILNSKKSIENFIAKHCFMFFLFSLFALIKSEDNPALCYQEETNCLKCVDTEGCGYCRTNKLCYFTNSTAEFDQCKDRSTTRDQKCVAELGGDAKPLVRYLIGGIFMIVAVLVDLSCRFFYKKPKPQAFLKQMVTIE